MATTFNRELGAEMVEMDRSAVSWASILAGAAVAIGTTLILIALGSGLGFAAASPWPGAAPSAQKFAIGVGVWLIVTQWLSSALAGYITGRLRTRYTGIHTKEVLFRDTAHGLLAWAVSTAIVGAVAFSVTISATSSAATAASASVDYATDTMLRSARPNAAASAEVRGEIARLLARGDDLQASDRSYLAQAVASQTGLTPAEAQRRVDTAVASIRDAADKARKASSVLGFFTALSMLIGAFIASAAAGYAGNLRDEHGELVPRR
jgi:hypothetical protein